MKSEMRNRQRERGGDGITYGHGVGIDEWRCKFTEGDLEKNVKKIVK